MTLSRTGAVVIAASLTAVLSACSAIPTSPPALPDRWVPSPSVSVLDQERLDSPLGYTPAERSAVRIRTLTCDALGNGSGFIIDDHTIVTNKHVVAGYMTIEINGSDGRDLTVASAATSTIADLAIITTVESLEPFASLAEADPTPGAGITVVGFPLGDQMTTSTGTILRRETDTLDNADHVFATNADVQHGSSGSAAYDSQGSVFGVVYAGLEEGSEGYIIPVSILKSALTGMTPLSPVVTCPF